MQFKSTSVHARARTYTDVNKTGEKLQDVLIQITTNYHNLKCRKSLLLHFVEPVVEFLQ